jgi:hypothetical protein
MLRLLTRFLAQLLLAGGFIALIVDGTRSIAGGQLAVTSLSAGLSELFPALYNGLRASVSARAQWLWDPVMTGVMTIPVSLSLAGLGALFILISTKREANRRYWRP